MSEKLSVDDLRTINSMIHGDNLMFRYHVYHVRLVAEYALVINERLSGDERALEKLQFIAYAHDLFKERSLQTDKHLEWNGIEIPQDNKRFVRMNLNTLDQYGIGDYFNTDVQLHALAAGIFLAQNGITDPEILYPVFFHSCPVISVYTTLDKHTQELVDITMLADKLSSNYLRINVRRKPVRVDLDLATFGPSGMEFNYSMGLFLARLISNGKSMEKINNEATQYYYDRLKQINPYLPRSYTVSRIGGSKIWPQRKSPALRTPWQSLRRL